MGFETAALWLFLSSYQGSSLLRLKLTCLCHIKAQYDWHTPKLSISLCLRPNTKKSTFTRKSATKYQLIRIKRKKNFNEFGSINSHKISNFLEKIGWVAPKKLSSNHLDMIPALRNNSKGHDNRTSVHPLTFVPYLRKLFIEI